MASCVDPQHSDRAHLRGAVETVHSAPSHQLWNSSYFLDLPDITTHRSLSCSIKSSPYLQGLDEQGSWGYP